MLEAHIMQAQAAAMAADERELQRISEGYENYQALGLPPGIWAWKHANGSIILSMKLYCNVWFQIMSILPHRRDWQFLGVGVS